MEACVNLADHRAIVPPQVAIPPLVRRAFPPARPEMKSSGLHQKKSTEGTTAPGRVLAPRVPSAFRSGVAPLTTRRSQG